MEFTFVFERASSSGVKQEQTFCSQNNPFYLYPTVPQKSILKAAGSPGPLKPMTQNVSGKENKEYTHSISNILKDAQTLNMYDVPSAENGMIVDSQDGVDGDSSLSSPMEEISCQLSTHLKSNKATQRTIEFPRVTKLATSSPTIPLIGRNGETPTDIICSRGYQPRRLLPDTPPVNPVLNFITASMGIPPLKTRTDFNSPSDHGRNDASDFTTDNDDDLANLAANAVNHFDSDDDIFDAEADVTPKPATNKNSIESKPDLVIMSPQDLLVQVRAKLSSIENKLSTHNVSHSPFGKSPELRGQRLSFSSPQSSDSTQGHDRQTSDVNIVPLFAKQSMSPATKQIALSASNQQLSSAFNRGNTGSGDVSSQTAASGSLQQDDTVVEGSRTLNDNSPDFTARLLSAEALLSPDSVKSDLPAVAQPTLDKLWSTPTLSVPPLVQRSAQVQKITPEPVQQSAQVQKIMPEPAQRSTQVQKIMPEPVHRSAQVQKITPEPVQRSAQVQKITPSLVAVSKSSQRNSKRKLTQSSANAKKKTARSSGGTKSSASKTKKRKVQEEVEEDPKYDFQCDSFDCIRPDDPLITWVQCDDCDKWYHTSCVGCRYEQVQNEHTEFHCGCR
ncbi:uncharacterized protein C01G6.5-like isoform X2 [Lineus longissimus]